MTPNKEVKTKEEIEEIAINLGYCSSDGYHNAETSCFIAGYDVAQQTRIALEGQGPVYNALRQLVRLKDLKELGTPDAIAEHEAGKDAAWENARAALNASSAAHPEGEKESFAASFAEWSCKNLWTVYNGMWFEYNNEDNPITTTDLITLYKSSLEKEGKD